MRMVIAAAAVLMSAAPAWGQSDEEAVGAVLDRLHGAASAADGAAYFALYTPDARFIGTDAAERWSLEEFRAYAAPHFSQGRGWTYEATARTVTIADIDCRCVAWFDEVLAHASYGVLRGSGVLRLTDDGWKVAQYVLSFAVPNDDAEAVVGVIRGGAE
ncbi:nuclear transport factor 2 family protein [Brevundimonas sp.]|uniref:nuclear transport factor 2 family protein n=1 Tax=Brevundimonas sp. TaxID=1871086 RepID=UPI0025BC4B55|nr:nuclear transport factor 2 family protein [Brevundimonas sp.]